MAVCNGTALWCNISEAAHLSTYWSCCCQMLLGFPRLSSRNRLGSEMHLPQKHQQLTLCCIVSRLLPSVHRACSCAPQNHTDVVVQLTCEPGEEEDHQFNFLIHSIFFKFVFVSFNCSFCYLLK